MYVEKISSYQVLALLFVSIMSTLTILFPTILGGVSGWISGLLASVYNLLIIGLIYILHKKAPQKSLIQTLDQHPIIKITASLIIVFFLFTLNAITITDLREIITNYLLPGTPISAILGVTLLLCATAARQGIEVLGRIAEWILPLIIITITIMTLFLLPDFEFERILPILESGWNPVFLASFHTFDFIGFIFVAFFMMPYVNRPDDIFKPLLIVTFLVAGSLFFQSVVTIGVLSEPLARQFLFPIVNLALYSQFTEVFQQGIEAFLLAFWQTTIVIKISLIIWVTSDLLRITLDLKDRRPLVIPITFLGGVWSLTMFPNIDFLIDFSNEFTYWAISIQFILPIFLLTFIYLRTNKSKPKVN